MPKEYHIEKSSINLRHNPEITVECRCGIYAVTSCQEYYCPVCGTVLIYENAIYKYRFNENYYQEIIEEVERERRKVA